MTKKKVLASENRVCKSISFIINDQLLYGFFRTTKKKKKNCGPILINFTNK